MKILYFEKGIKCFLYEKCEFLVYWLIDIFNVIIFIILKLKLFFFFLEILYIEFCYLIIVGILNFKLFVIFCIVLDIVKVKSYIFDEVNGYIYFWYYVEDFVFMWIVLRIEEI